MGKVKWHVFLWDVFLASLGSYGGPEAHYGIFSSLLVQKRKYITEEELTEKIGLYALIPGPSSTQTVTSIGYHVGGPVLAILTFLVWAFPAIIIMSLIGVFFTVISGHEGWRPIMTYLPAIAVSFIIYAAYSLSKKVLKKLKDWIVYALMLISGLLLVGYSMWIVPIMLLLGGSIYLMPHRKEQTIIDNKLKPKWLILIVVIGIAILNEGLRIWFNSNLVILFTSFYRYGYSVIGGGQIVIPLMIQDLVQTQSLISLNDFLSGYAIDQAVPGPLFSFAAFISSRSFEGSNFAFLAGLIGGISIFLPGLLLVFFIFPLWKKSRKIKKIRYFLSGVSVTAASLILMTAINQTIKLPVDFAVYGVVIIGALLLISKKVPAPLIVLLAAILGFVI